MNLNKLHNDIHEGALQLMAEHRAQLFAKARSLCDSDDEAEELVILTIDKAIRKINTYSSEGDILSWMATILENLHNDAHRSRIVRGTVAVEADALERCAGADWSTVEQILTNSDHDVLRMAIQQLDPEYRRLVAMYYFNELSLGEIAALINSSTSTVSRKLEVARKILFAKLKTKLGKKPFAVIAAILAFVSAATAAVATVPALAPVRDTVVSWFAGGDADPSGTGDDGETGGGGATDSGTGVSPVQPEAIQEQDNTTIQDTHIIPEKEKENAMNAKRIAALTGVALAGLSAVAGATAESAPVDARNIADAERWQTVFDEKPLKWHWPDAAVSATLTVSNAVRRKVTHYAVSRAGAAEEGSFAVPELKLAGDGERLFDVTVAFSSGETLSARLAVVNLSSKLDVPLVASKPFSDVKGPGRLAFCEEGEALVATPLDGTPVTVVSPVMAGYNAVDVGRILEPKTYFTLAEDDLLISPLLRYASGGLMLILR